MEQPGVGRFSFTYPYRTLQQLKDFSPSRAHGVSEEVEDRWKRAAILLIIDIGLALQMYVVPGGQFSLFSSPANYVD